MQKLILIDGNAILHRAYHALPPLSKNGVPTNAVYGFFAMLFKIISDLRPEYLIVCFDREAPTFRKQMYVGYQSTRPALDNDFIPQIKTVHKVLDTAKIPHFGIDGYEADDLIGTLSKQGVEKGLEVIIVSGDRDLLQLVNSHVLMLAPITGITNMALFDETKVREKYGLNPIQIIDYKSLVGDASDNYPGVTGIGPKGAANLLQKYETLEGVYKHLAELSPQLQEKLANDAEQAALAKKLATIIVDAPLKIDVEKAKISQIDVKALTKMFEKLGFTSLLKRMPQLERDVAKEPVQVQSPKNKNDNDQMSLL